MEGLDLRVKIDVVGIVQGVGFRPFVYRTAVRHALTGYVRNRGDAGVEILLEGPSPAIDGFLSDLHVRKPPQAHIHNVQTTSLTGKNEFSNFTIFSSSQSAEHSGSVVPPDIAICNECLCELRNPKDPRFEYFFITCTNCGPRYTIIERLPYDRQNTTMREFPLCGFCKKEYENPANRRFHAQTVACPSCGPKAYLTTREGETVKSADPIRETGRLLSKGNIVAVKGYGGFHIAASVTNEKTLRALRISKQRSKKPFAIMARDLNAIKSFAEVSKKEQALLTSPARPIVLLNKSSRYNFSELVAPDLHNVGVMLPYSAMHYMLFDCIDDEAFVMTSANPANQPIINDNNEALKTLGSTVAYFLFHNRSIAQRCDDSVLRVHDDREVFIRRSRGYAPAPILLKEKAKRCVLALGSELNNTSCILNDDKAFLSQHIGDVENLETRKFLQEATQHLNHLTNTKIEAVACDLHPKFTTTQLAKEIAKENNYELIQVQHHHAHIAALLAEHDVKEMVGIACDGYGYGTDATAWGGELLLCSHGSRDFTRLGHLEAQPIIGGDTATKYPMRIAAGILSKKTDVDQWILQNSAHLPHGEPEAHLIINQLKKSNFIPNTTSLGRILDAVSAVLGICFERTYEGEAAIKLESAAIGGKDVLYLSPIVSQNMLNTSELLLTIFENRATYSHPDLAYSAHTYLGKGLASLAIEKALEQNVKTIGFSGGTAVNILLAQIIRKTVEAAGLRFVVHECIPPGDGGVSFGQSVVGAFSRF